MVIAKRHLQAAETDSRMITMFSLWSCTVPLRRSLTPFLAEKPITEFLSLVEVPCLGCAKPATNHFPLQLCEECFATTTVCSNVCRICGEERDVIGECEWCRTPICNATYCQVRTSAQTNWCTCISCWLQGKDDETCATCGIEFPSVSFPILQRYILSGHLYIDDIQLPFQINCESCSKRNILEKS